MSALLLQNCLLAAVFLSGCKKQKKMKIKFKKYRIVKDNYCGFECQVWRLWFPFWIQMGFTNTHTSLEKAKEYISTRGEVWRSS